MTEREYSVVREAIKRGSLSRSDVGDIVNSKEPGVVDPLIDHLLRVAKYLYPQDGRFFPSKAGRNALAEYDLATAKARRTWWAGRRDKLFDGAIGRVGAFVAGGVLVAATWAWKEWREVRNAPASTQATTQP